MLRKEPIPDGYGGYSNVNTRNLIQACATRTGFSNHFDEKEGLRFAFVSQAVGLRQVRELNRSWTPTLKNYDRPPYWEMPLGHTRSETCDGGLHVSPKYVLNHINQLATVNIASVSLISGKPISDLKRCWRAVWDRKKNLPFDNVKALWEYTVMLLFKRQGRLYVYHHVGSANSSERWRTFEQQVQTYIQTGTANDKVKDSLWLIWRLPDITWQMKNPEFFDSIPQLP